jgi:hypothetical protein
MSKINHIAVAVDNILYLGRELAHITTQFFVNKDLPWFYLNDFWYP